LLIRRQRQMCIRDRNKIEELENTNKNYINKIEELENKFNNKLYNELLNKEKNILNEMNILKDKHKEFEVMLNNI
jgi:hypothetical protein